MKHCDQTLSLLKKTIGRPAEVKEILDTATDVASRWVDPASGGKEQTNGLIYGLVQSGKTGVLSVTGAIGADQGYRAIIVLTSDNDPLYDQTLGRIREAFPGMDVMGKADLNDPRSFAKRLRGSSCAIVITKNKSLLEKLNDNLRTSNVRGIPCLIIDDEADQASLNTRERKADGTFSPINDAIRALRAFFDKNTYLQVTATPQALFLQIPGHDFRPKFTVLSHPGNDYVGGDDFFGAQSSLVREFDINDMAALAAGAQPAASLNIPKSLLQALDTFIVGATFKRMGDVTQNCAFLCHVSLRTDDHKHIEQLLWQYKLDLTEAVKARNKSVLTRLKGAYDDLSQSHAPLRKITFEAIVEEIEFLSPGIAVKLVNGDTDESVAVRAPYNLFVGGNKLGRGVTIKNLLVSYYGRNPGTPQADTVLQHARMYGYRRSDIGLLRLFLPRTLHLVFRAIHKMETGLRDLIEASPGEAFRGVYVEGRLRATRANVLAPGAIGSYVGGGTYNPSQVLRDRSIVPSTKALDSALSKVGDKSFVEMPIEDVRKLIELTRPDEAQSEHVWNPIAVAETVTQYATLTGQVKAYVYVDRDRGLKEARLETQGVLSGGEAGLVPNDKLTVFLLRTKPERGMEAAWWPQIRFPAGNYAFAFAI